MDVKESNSEGEVNSASVSNSFIESPMFPIQPVGNRMGESAYKSAAWATILEDLEFDIGNIQYPPIPALGNEPAKIDDSVYIEHYIASPATFAGTQRKRTHLNIFRRRPLTTKSIRRCAGPP